MAARSRWIISLLALALGTSLAWRMGAAPRMPLAEASGGSRDLVVWGFDPELGWAPTPNAGVGQVTIGPQGARGPVDYPPAPARDALRLVAVGESFVFGLEVADGECWSAQLEALEPRLEAINLGVPGYGPDQALLRYRRDGAPLDPQVAVIGVGFTSIARVVNRLRSRLRPAHGAPSVKPRFRLSRGELELVPLPFASGTELRAAADELRLEAMLDSHEYWRPGPAGPAAKVLGRAIDRDNGPGRRDVRHLWLSRKHEAYRLTLAILTQFARETRARGARPLVLYFPEAWELENHGRDDRSHLDRMGADLALRGVELLDLTPALALAEESVHRALHLNPAGHRVVARTVRAWLQRHAREPCQGR